MSLDECAILQDAMKDIVTVEEAAKFLHKHPDTIRRWIEAKGLKARHLSAGSHGIYAILRNDLLEFAVSASVKESERRIKKKPHQPAIPPQPTLPI